MKNVVLTASVFLGERLAERAGQAPTSPPAPSPASSGGNVGALLWTLLALAAVVGLGLAVHYVGRRLRHRRRNSHPALFRALCRVHQLDGDDRRLLRLVLQHHRLAQPGRLFTEPRWLDPSCLDDSLRGRAPQLAALRQRLFGTDPASDVA